MHTDARNYLMQIRRLDERISEMEASASWAYERATNITAQYNKVAIDHSNDNHHVEENYAELTERIDWMKAQLLSLEADILATISKVPNNEQARLLTNYYCRCWSFEKCAVEMHYSYRHIIRMHRKALNEVDAILASCP